MRKGTATPERFNGRSITIPAQTRSPLEAFKMLRAGQPVDIMAGYYERQGMEIGDFHLKDKLEKLRILAEFRENLKRHQTDIETLTLQIQHDEQQEKQRKDAEPQGPGGAIPNGSPGPANTSKPNEPG